MLLWSGMWARHEGGGLSMLPDTWDSAGPETIRRLLHFQGWYLSWGDWKAGHPDKHLLVTVSVNCLLDGLQLLPTFCWLQACHYGQCRCKVEGAWPLPLCGRVAKLHWVCCQCNLWKLHSAAMAPCSLLPGQLGKRVKWESVSLAHVSCGATSKTPCH